MRCFTQNTEQYTICGKVSTFQQQDCAPLSGGFDFEMGRAIPKTGTFTSGVEEITQNAQQACEHDIIKSLLC